MGEDCGPRPATGSSRRSRIWNAAIAAAAAALVVGCHGHGASPSGDGGADGSVACTDTNGMRKPTGIACGCNGDCASGFCVDSVCCNSACTETCKSCNTPSSPGVCAFVPPGAPPRSASTCPASDVSSCGLDGTCNGSGACRTHMAGTTCAPGTCDGAAVKNIRVCDGQGTCTSGPATICAPFGCDPSTNACVVTCTSDTDCASGIKCVAGSCGPKPIGAVCSASSQCASNFCADGFCCNVACTGACVSCSQSGRIGTCWPISVGNPDPHLICVGSSQATCGQTGRCDGIGGCAKYAAETVCVAPSCSGDRLNTAGTCDGLGTCRPQGVQTCDPYQCTDGACVSRCTGDSDCVTTHKCVSGSCGPKSNGQACTAAGQCASNFCVDGVCCADACQGACRSCALGSSLGTCTPSPAAAADPHNKCANMPATSCGTDGTCDGAGSCHKYAPGTTCASEQCVAGVYTAASACDANGNCMAPDALTCAPYICNGARCFSGCTDSTDCSSGNVCTSNSCGLKPNGAFCSTKFECKSSNCAQGVCCVSACASACQSCALTGMMGTCTAVPAGMPDPAATCLDQGGTSCGTNGKCQAGACQKYVQGTPCAGASCPATGTTFTPASSCDGAGACVTPMSSSCAPFGCGGASCKTSCTADADCAPPASCNAGSCGLKPPGAVCGSGAECAGPGICAQGACCLTTCASKCMSCGLAASAGTCTPIAASGTDPTGQCTDQGASSCKATGFCDGSGGCQLYAAGTQCAAPSCATGTTIASLARTCDGAGTCKPATTQSCAPFACNGTTCIAVCGADSDCAPGNVCNSGSCGLKRLGQLCNAGTDCGSGNCVDGVCCSAASCGTCSACNVGGQAGSCQPTVAGGAEPHGGCAASPPCGFNGTCDGAGACRNAAPTTSCGTASCSGSTYTPVGACDGAGTCAQPPVGCGHYSCGAGVCLTMCGGDGDCTGAGYTCQSSSCTNLKPPGVACVSGTECLSNLCTDGVCCKSGPCGSCSSCALNGKGTCAPVAAGGTDPAGLCMDTGAASCGTTGVCDGAGNCANYPAGGACAPASCPDGMSLKTSVCVAGQCKPSTANCTPFACDLANTVCKTMCTADTDCASGFTCSGSVGAPGTCQ